MPKYKLLLLDAGIIIGLYELGIWERFIDKCSVTMTRTVAKDEAHMWRDDEGDRQDFNLDDDIECGRVSCVDVPLETVIAFRQQFSPDYMDRLHAGEAESLAYLFGSSEQWILSSADAFVFRVLGRLGRSEQGLSLEEILQDIGLTHSLVWKYRRAFREKYTKQGQQDCVTGRGLKGKE